MNKYRISSYIMSAAILFATGYLFYLMLLNPITILVVGLVLFVSGCVVLICWLIWRAFKDLADVIYYKVFR